MTEQDKEAITVTLQYIQRDIQEIKTQLQRQGDSYLTKGEWLPYQKIIQGLVGVILLAVIAAIVQLVIKR